MHSDYHLIILIDDDPVQNHVNKIVIRQYLRPQTADIISFTSPVCGLAYLKEKNFYEDEQALLLVDVNMPGQSGWEFLENISQLNESILQHLTIYMLSSSIDPADRAKASQSPLVKDFITKPLSDHLKNVFEEPAQ